MNNKEITITLKKCSVKYIDEIINYLKLARKSNVIINNTDRGLTHKGYRLIAHIFQTNLMHTGDIDTAHCSIHKGYLYYLEYLEQIETSNINNDLNDQSAVLFIYDKTLIKYREENRSSIKMDHTVLSTVPRITKLIETILWFGNTIIQQVGIDFNTVKSICEMLNNANDNLISSYIEFGQKRNMTTVEYNEFLHHTLKIFRENARYKTHSESDWKEQMLKKLPHIDEAKNQVISKWCKWLWI
jgi:hypothetical protein